MFRSVNVDSVSSIWSKKIQMCFPLLSKRWVLQVKKEFLPLDQSDCAAAASAAAWFPFEDASSSLGKLTAAMATREWEERRRALWHSDEEEQSFKCFQSVSPTPDELHRQQTLSCVLYWNTSSHTSVAQPKDWQASNWYWRRAFMAPADNLVTMFPSRKCISRQFICDYVPS